jgi:hypothetical protein
MGLQLTDSQQVHLTLAEKDKAGNPVSPSTVPVWLSSNTDVVTLSVAADGLSADAVTTGAIGSATISASSDNLTGTLDVTVVPGAAVTIELDAGTPTEKA